MTLQIEISPQTEALLIEEASNPGIDISTLVEILGLSSKLHSTPISRTERTPDRTAGEIIREIGFAECGPTDLTTNSVHMEGFGETKSLAQGKT